MDTTNSDEERTDSEKQNDEALLNSEKSKFLQFLRNIGRDDYASGSPFLGGATEFDSDAESDPDRATDSDSAGDGSEIDDEADSNADSSEDLEPEEEPYSAQSTSEQNPVSSDQSNTCPASDLSTAPSVDSTAASACEPSTVTPVTEPPPEFYDPVADEGDARWVEGIRRGYLCRPACLEAATDSVPPGTSSIAPSQSPPTQQPTVIVTVGPKNKVGSKLVQPSRKDGPRAAPESQAQEGRPLPESDARLDCPCCMTTLCYDSQRHELVKSQYRAMFVTSACETDASSTLHCPLEAGDATRRGRKRGARDDGVRAELLRRLNAADSGPSPSSASASSQAAPPACAGERDLFNPVKCSRCGTRVGVRECSGDRLYHFVNVLASHT